METLDVAQYKLLEVANYYDALNDNPNYHGSFYKRKIIIPKEGMILSRVHDVVIVKNFNDFIFLADKIQFVPNNGCLPVVCLQNSDIRIVPKNKLKVELHYILLNSEARKELMNTDLILDHKIYIKNGLLAEV